MALTGIIAKNGAHNSYDRWHIARSAAKEMKKISNGTKKTKGVTWHPELADKVSRMRNHLYWSMEHCNGDETTLKRNLDTAIDHFQMRHDGCDASSVCRQPGYIPDFIVLQDPAAVRLLTKFVHTSAIYRRPADYIYGRDTYLVESYNNVMLLYIDKRIHYGNQTYEMRRNLASSIGTNMCHVATRLCGVVDTGIRKARQRKETLCAKDFHVRNQDMGRAAVSNFLRRD